MKILMKIIKFFLKLIAILVALTIFFSGVFLAMIYFSDRDYYTSIVEKEFIESTGQKLVVTGDMNFKPGKYLNATFTDSTITLVTNIGNIDFMTKKLYLGVPWISLFRQKIDKAPFEATQIHVKINQDKKLKFEYQAPYLFANIERTCCELWFKDIKLTANEGDLTGNIKIVPEKTQLRLSGALHAKKWTLAKPIDPKTKILNFESERDLIGTVDFNIDSLQTPQGEMNNVEALIDFGAKILTIKSSHVILGPPQVKK